MGDEVVPSTFEDVASGKYPLSRRVFLYADKVPGLPFEHPIELFLQFILSGEGQALARRAGYVSLPRSELEEELRKLRS